MPRYDLGDASDFPEDVPQHAKTACRDLVVVRHGGEFYALDHACQHLGAPLSKAVVDDGALVCPWHRAVIRLSDGHLDEPPGCRHQRRYPVTVEDGHLIVDIDPDEPSYRESTFSPAPAEGPQPESVLVLGAGAAGLTAAQTLAEGGFRGQITVVSDEAESSVDRTKFSKGLLRDRGTAFTGAFNALRENGLRSIEGKVTGVSLEKREATLADGSVLSAAAMILATGGEPKRLDLPGKDLDGVMTLRTLGDALTLACLADQAERAVVIGAGFIGMEAAATLAGEDIDVTVLAREELPFARIVGERIAKRLVREQERAGVRLRTRTNAKAFLGEGRVRGVALDDGTTLDADLVIVATGVRPRTDLFTGLELDEEGGIGVGADLRVPGFDGVFAAGDIARVPTPFGTFRFEHWRWAQQLGRRAAEEVLGLERAGPVAPFFWTKQHAAGSYVYVGHANDPDDIVYEGDPDDGEFIAYFLEGERCTGLFGFGMADRMSRLERAMARSGPLPRGDLELQ